MFQPLFATQTVPSPQTTNMCSSVTLIPIGPVVGPGVNPMSHSFRLTVPRLRVLVDKDPKTRRILNGNFFEMDEGSARDWGQLKVVAAEPLGDPGGRILSVDRSIGF